MQKRTWPIYNYLERTSLVNNAYVKEIHDDAHLRLKRALTSMARGRFNLSGENANRQNWQPKTSGQPSFRCESPTGVAWSLGFRGKKCYLLLCRSRSRELTEGYASRGKAQWRPYFSRSMDNRFKFRISTRAGNLISKSGEYSIRNVAHESKLVTESTNRLWWHKKKSRSTYSITTSPSKKLECQKTK